MKFEDIKNPSDLLVFMSKIEYGYISDDGEIYTLEDEDFSYHWVLSEPDRLIQKMRGNCFDRVELERFWFSKNGYDFKTFFTMFQLEEENPFFMHAYAVYEDKKTGRFCYFDSESGIKEFSSYLDAAKYQLKEHIVLNNKVRPLKKHEIESLYVYEYGSVPFGIDLYQFIDEILEKGTLYL